MSLYGAAQTKLVLSLVPRPPPFLPSVCAHNNTWEMSLHGTAQTKLVSNPDPLHPSKRKGGQGLGCVLHMHSNLSLVSHNCVCQNQYGRTSFVSVSYLSSLVREQDTQCVLVMRTTSCYAQERMMTSFFIVEGGGRVCNFLFWPW